MRQVHTTFPCGDILLEGVWHFPLVTEPSPAVIVCHPHPLYGGSMSSSTVLAICQTLARYSITAFRFNFRGVGKSGGEYGGGIDEQEDVKAALDLITLTSGIDRERIGLAGYSFGAGVGVPVAVRDERVSLLAMVSPALLDSGWQQLKECSKPKFMISGSHDFIIPPQQLEQYVRDTPELREFEVISGANHFWQGYEDEVADKVARFFANGFSLTEPG